MLLLELASAPVSQLPGAVRGKVRRGVLLDILFGDRLGPMLRLLLEHMLRLSCMTAPHVYTIEFLKPLPVRPTFDQYVPRRHLDRKRVWGQDAGKP